MSSYEVDIRVDGETLVAEWDNRKLGQDRFTVIFLTLFWVVWTPVTSFRQIQPFAIVHVIVGEQSIAWRNEISFVDGGKERNSEQKPNQTSKEESH